MHGVLSGPAGCLASSINKVLFPNLNYCSKGNLVGCLKNDGPLLAIHYITAPNIQGYQNGALILGTTHVVAFNQVRLYSP